MGETSYSMSIGIIWTVGMLVLAVTGLVLWHRSQNAKARTAPVAQADQLQAISAQLADLQARVGKIEKVLSSVD